MDFYPRGSGALLCLYPCPRLFLFLVLRGLLALAAGGGSSILGGFFLAEPFLLAFNELGEGGTASLFAFECLVLGQVFKEWYGLNDHWMSL